MNGNGPIRVLIVDDHTMLRKGLTTVLTAADGIEVVGEAANGAAAVQRCADSCPHVVLLDMVLPDMDGATTTEVICRRYPGIRILILSSFPEETLVQRALRAGAVGYLLKDVSADELIEAVHLAAVGKGTLSPAAQQALIREAQRFPALGHDLTPRELEVLALLVEGLSNNQIAEKLTVESSTIKTHVSKILAKLDAVSRSEAAAIAVRNGLV